MLDTSLETGRTQHLKKVKVASAYEQNWKILNSNKTSARNAMLEIGQQYLIVTQSVKEVEAQPKKEQSDRD